MKSNSIQPGGLIARMFNGSLRLMIITIISSTIGMVVDGIVIGQYYGAAGTAAYGLSGPILLLIVAFGGVFSSGCQSVCAGSLGRGDSTGAKETFSTAFFYSLWASLGLTAVIVIFASPVARLLGATPELLPDAKAYISGYSLGVPALIIVSILQPMLQFEGKSEMVMVSILILTGTDIAGDILSAAVFHGGLFGMGAATSVSYYASLIYLLLYFLSGKSFFRPDLRESKAEHLKQIVPSGLPTAVSRLGNTGKCLLMNRIALAAAGSLGVAALSVQTSVESFLGCVCVGIGMAMLLVSSVVYGEENRNGLVTLFRHSVKVTAVITGLVGCFIFIAAPFLVSLFLREEAAQKISVTCIRIYAFSMPFTGFNCCIQNYYQATRKLKLANMICVLEKLVFISLSAFILSRFLGAAGVFLGIPAGEACMTLTVLIAAAVRAGSVRFTWDDLLAIGRDYGAAKDDTLEMSVRSNTELSSAAVSAKKFCEERGIDSRTAGHCSLAVEELVGNVIEHGRNSTAEVRVVIKDGGVILRIRDDSEGFDPVSYWEKLTDSDPTRNVGIRLVMNIVKDIRYSYSVRMNNLIVTL